MRTVVMRRFNRRTRMNNIFWAIGVVVVVGLLFGYFRFGY
jgi:hypothetical protein